MKAIETHGIVDHDGHLVLTDRIPLPPDAPVRVIVLAPEEDEVEERDWLRSAAANEAFDFLKDPAEDIYGPADGKPFHDAP
jgi:hypothetical protein